MVLDEHAYKCFLTLQIPFQYDLFLAGTDTSRAFIEWTLIYMAAMPEFQDKLYREIKEKIGDRFPQVSDKLSELYIANCDIA